MNAYYNLNDSMMMDNVSAMCVMRASCCTCMRAPRPSP
jgi:hypothetical protein